MADEKDGKWHPYFALWPVWVDAYSNAEMFAHGNRFRWRRVGWVERRWDTWIDDNDDRTQRAVWRYRMSRKVKQ